MKFANLI